ncbi:hypothetical protein [Cellulomonas carbonis]|uniref:(2Fe-2S) ferredoxin domain-containing protein n=1 Tax=Cellulomonas carbonis T26 TaxID=947969 RepID=A0A0A0BXU6_9CELL|nr:hypothetical protein [Cellulomonas carbonis]KGM12532.1 hypothetical protein N868_09695 [Cellulomonas carbonis T26]GGB93687.1 hypothetical protein GCM10010972_02950 [Cellulomonas carbonis]
MSTTDPVPAATTPALTACSLCSGETLGDGDAPGGQMARLRAIEEAGLARLALVECLDECERGDVVVVRPSPHGRRCGGRPVWFEQLAGPERSEALARWLGSGGPGVASLPDELAPVRIERSRDADDDAGSAAGEPGTAAPGTGAAGQAAGVTTDASACCIPAHH